MLLANRVALIVGAGHGLGKAVAQAYAREGAVIIAADRDLPAAQRTVAGIGANTTGTAHPIDVMDARQCSNLVATAVEEFDKLDVLVNCAAICLVDPLVDVTPERWDQVFAVNAKGAFFLMQAAAKAMIPRKFGRIINVSSPASRMGLPDFASYAASKAAVDSMTRAAAVAWAPHGITANVIVPGRLTGGIIGKLEADLARLRGVDLQQLHDEQTNSIPLKRRGAPEEVAQAAVWLASDAASYVTAARLNVSGGLELS